ncbi:MAG: PEP-CTERM sorting domain-containing protein [Chthoniobacterales bacterium]
MSYFPPSPAGIWQLLDGDTIAKSVGYFPTPVFGLDVGDLLTSLSSTDGNDLYARSADGFLYQIDSSGFAFKSSYLDVSYFSSSPAGIWQLLDGDTIAKSVGYFPTTVYGLQDGDLLTSLSTSDSIKLYARGSAPIPEPGTCALAALGLAVLSYRIRRRA